MKHTPCMRRILAAFEQHGPLDGHQVAALAHVSFAYFQNHCRHQLERDQAIHLHGYRHNKSGPFIPVYAPGPAMGPAPKKPDPIDHREYTRQWKESTGYYALQKAQRRLRNVKRVDPVLAAMTAANDTRKAA